MTKDSLGGQQKHNRVLALLLGALTLAGASARAQGLQLSVGTTGAYVGYPFTITNFVYSSDGYDTQVTNVLPGSFRIVGTSCDQGYFTTNSSTNLVWSLYPAPVGQTVEATITVVPTIPGFFNWAVTATDFGYDTNRTATVRVVATGPLVIKSYDPARDALVVSGATKGDFYVTEISTNLQSGWISVQTNSASSGNPTFTLLVIPPSPAFIRVMDLNAAEVFVQRN